LREQTFKDFEIIFVDNDSSDESYIYAKENFKQDNVKIFKTDKNLGFAGGNNFALKHCSGEFIVLLNNDTRVQKDWLEKLIDCISTDENTGIAQSLVITEGIPAKYYEMNGTINLLGHNIMEIYKIDDNGQGEIFQANGCSMIIRKKLTDELGGLFPEEYFAYSEDTFLCFRVKFRGLKIMHTSDSVVFHKGGGASVNQKASALYFYQERNRLLNFLIFFSQDFFVRYIPFLIFNFFLKLSVSVFSGKYSAVQLVKAYRWLFTNRQWIRKERAYLNGMKKVKDEEVMRYISGKIFNGNNIAEKIVNTFSIGYCKLAGIHVFENQKSA